MVLYCGFRYKERGRLTIGRVEIVVGCKIENVFSSTKDKGH